MPRKKKTIEFQYQIKDFREKAIYILTSPWRFFKFVCFSIGLAVILATFFVFLSAFYFFSSLPNFENMTFDQLRARAVESVMEKRENKKAKHNWVQLKEIHRDLIYAITFSEDSKFFEHSGVNYDATLRAMAQNWKKKKIISGASTITQQVIKNLFLTREKSFMRKFKEAVLAVSLENYFHKNQILEVYLNIIEVGPEIYGVDQASQYYFHKNPGEISAGEGAFMALMLPSPRKNHYRIFVKKNLSKKRKGHLRRVLYDMMYNEFITKREFMKYMKRDYFAHAPKGN